MVTEHCRIRLTNRRFLLVAVEVAPHELQKPPYSDPVDITFQQVDYCASLVTIVAHACGLSSDELAVPCCGCSLDRALCSTSGELRHAERSKIKDRTMSTEKRVECNSRLVRSVEARPHAVATVAEAQRAEDALRCLVVCRNERVGAAPEPTRFVTEIVTVKSNARRLQSVPVHVEQRRHCQFRQSFATMRLHHARQSCVMWSTECCVKGLYHTTYLQGVEHAERALVVGQAPADQLGALASHSANADARMLGDHRPHLQQRRR